MLSAIGRRAYRWAAAPDPFTDVYGLVRTILALATAGTLAATQPSTLFHVAAGMAKAPPVCLSKLGMSGLFCLVPLPLEALRWAAVALLLVVASGYRPRYTGLLHWWISMSLVNEAVLIDGGDQVAMILSMLLVPVTLCDDRRWHWDAPRERRLDTAELLRRLLARTCHALIMVQVAGVYFHASVGKLAIAEWADGTALYYWLLHPGVGASPWLSWLIRPFLTFGPTVTLLTWSVLAVELVLCMMLFAAPERRRLALPLGIGLHVGIILVHGLVSFGCVMCAALLLYLHPADRPLGLAPSLPAWLRRAKIHGTVLSPST